MPYKNPNNFRSHSFWLTSCVFYWDIDDDWWLTAKTYPWCSCEQPSLFVVSSANSLLGKRALIMGLLLVPIFMTTDLVRFEFIFLQDLVFLQFPELLHFFVVCQSHHSAINVSSILVVIHPILLSSAQFRICNWIFVSSIVHYLSNEGNTSPTCSTPSHVVRSHLNELIWAPPLLS